MTSTQICEIADGLIEKFDTRNPREIAEEMGIFVWHAPLSRIKGGYSVFKDRRIILINSDISDEMKAIVCAHELGHSQLHKEFTVPGAEDTFEFFDMTARTELEANMFAAELLLKDEDVIECMKLGYTTQQIAMALNTEKELVEIKFNIMKNLGDEVRIPEMPRGDFLK